MSNPTKRAGKKVIKAWADIGSHGGIFEFQIGRVADYYPHLLHVFSKRVTPDLIPVEIHIPTPPKKKKA